MEHGTQNPDIRTNLQLNPVSIYTKFWTVSYYTKRYLCRAHPFSCVCLPDCGRIYSYKKQVFLYPAGLCRNQWNTNGICWMVLTGHIMLFYNSLGSDQAYSSHLSLRITPISSIISLVIRSIVLFISLKWDALLPSFKSLKLIQGFVCFQNSQLLLEWYSFCEFCIISSMRDIIVLSFGFSISYASLRGIHYCPLKMDKVKN